VYPWPTGNFDYIVVMDDSLYIALHYLDRTGQAVHQEAQSTAAAAIVTAWRAGVRHRIKLADIAIKAVGREVEPVMKQSNCVERSTRLHKY
jgi:hypothetical protein